MNTAGHAFQFQPGEWQCLELNEVLPRLEICRKFFHFISCQLIIHDQPEDSNPRRCDTILIFKWLPIFLVTACYLHLQDPNSLIGPRITYLVDGVIYYHRKNIGNGLAIDTTSYSRTTQSLFSPVCGTSDLSSSYSLALCRRQTQVKKRHYVNK